MDLSSLSNYLLSIKSLASDPRNLGGVGGDVGVVLGNEAADLDSVISSIVCAFYLAHSALKERAEDKENEGRGERPLTLVLPVINCPRQDLPLRTEVLFVLQLHQISVDSLICRDELDLAGLQSAGRLRVTLVDHNVLAANDAFLNPCVERVIDHHKRERTLGRRDIIQPVGSCATLVAEIVLGLFETDLLVLTLLYGTILLDTVNLSPEAGRTTDKDVRIVNELETALSKMTSSFPNRNQVYGPIVAARSDISQLTPEQLLRKDCKVLKTGESCIVIPAVPLLSQRFVEMAGGMDALNVVLRNHRSSAIVLMGFEVKEGEGIRRDIAVFSDSLPKAQQVSGPLEKCETLELELVRQALEPQSSLFVYNQRNVTCSRKFILPFLANHLEGKSEVQKSIDVDALAGVEILIGSSNGENSPNKATQGYNGVPTISCSSVQNLAVGDPISHTGSNQSSAYNSCPYTPQNSCAEPEEGVSGADLYFLPSFNSREMIEKIESKRHKLRGYDRAEESLNPSSYPFTPKNSYVDSSLDTLYADRAAPPTHNLSAIDSEVLVRKLLEKRRGESGAGSGSFSNTSSKSDSLTKLNVEEVTSAGDMTSHPTNDNSD